MLISIVVLLPVIALIALAGRGCSFAPAGPTVDESSMPKVDARAALITAARRMRFEIRSPVVPPGWRANSTDQRPAPGAASAVRVGWVTADGHYLRLVQTAAAGDEGPLVAAETSGAPSARGVVAVSGADWVRYAAPNGEQAWVGTADGTRRLITGDGTEQDFEALAAAVTAAPALPRPG